METSSTLKYFFEPLMWQTFLSVQKQPPEVFYKEGVLRIFARFTGKHLYRSLFFNKVAGLRPATLLKKRLWRRCFPVNFTNFLRVPSLQNISGRLLLWVFYINFFTLFFIFFHFAVYQSKLFAEGNWLVSCIILEKEFLKNHFTHFQLILKFHITSSWVWNLVLNKTLSSTRLLTQRRLLWTFEKPKCLLEMSNDSNIWNMNGDRNFRETYHETH